MGHIRKRKEEETAAEIVRLVRAQVPRLPSSSTAVTPSRYKPGSLWMFHMFYRIDCSTWMQINIVPAKQTKLHSSQLLPKSEGRKPGGVGKSLQCSVVLRRHATRPSGLTIRPGWGELGDGPGGLFHFLALCVLFPGVSTAITTAGSYSRYSTDARPARGTLQAVTPTPSFLQECSSLQNVLLLHY